MIEKIANRILRHGMINPCEILKNPANWRRHPEHQVKAMGGILKEIGWVQQVVVNANTNTLLDGHLRVELAEKNNEHEVPVVYVDLTAEEEAKVLATFDKIGELAVTDQKALDEVLHSIESDDPDFLGFVEGLISPEIDAGQFSAENEWVGMPSFVQENIESFRHVIVHFRNGDDAKRFFELIGVSDTGKTKSMWYPEQQDQLDSEANRYES